MSMRPMPCAPASWFSSAIICERGLRRAVERHRQAALEADRDLVGLRGRGRVVGVAVDVVLRGVPDVLQDARSRSCGPRRSGRSSTASAPSRRSAGPSPRRTRSPCPWSCPSRGPAPCRFTSGASAARPASNRTWSLPLPVQPCATRVGAVFLGDPGQVLDDQRPRQRRHQRVAVHVERVRPAGPGCSSPPRTHRARPRPRPRPRRSPAPAPDRLQVLTALADVDRERDDLGPGLLRDPADRHRRVQPAGIREHYLVRHRCSSSVVRVCRESMRGHDRPPGCRPLATAGRVTALGEPQQRLGELLAAGRVPGDDQDGVVAADGAEHGGPAGVVDRRREQLRGARGRAQDDQVGAGLGGDEQLRGHPGQPGRWLDRELAEQAAAQLPVRLRPARARQPRRSAGTPSPPGSSSSPAARTPGAVGGAQPHRPDLLQVPRQRRLRHPQADVASRSASSSWDRTGADRWPRMLAIRACRAAFVAGLACRQRVPPAVRRGRAASTRAPSARAAGSRPARTRATPGRR